MKGKDATGPDVSDEDFQNLRLALRQMPAPEPRAGFVERALARAAMQSRGQQAESLPGRLRNFAMRWETWAGAALGGAVAAALTFVLLRTVDTSAVRPQPQLALTLHEARNVDVLIDSERELKGATIRIAASGSIALDGFDDERQMDWQADLERGANLLSLPVVARTAGRGRLVAVVEHAGRTQRVTIDLTVVAPKESRS
jgi:hypothetical protein